MFTGIDVRSEGLNCVSLDAARRIRESALVRTEQLDRLPEWVLDSKVVAIDAPAQISTAPHADEAALSTKFRSARCAEIALARECGYWVPFTTPTRELTDGWMKVGLDLYDVLSRTSDTEVIEVYPYAGFRELANREPLAKKATIAGILQRTKLLRGAGLEGQWLEMWSHDSLDALVAALIARERAEGIARRITCGHDDSAIWLPRGA